jgi:hypothetical protein
MYLSYSLKDVTSISSKWKKTFKKLKSRNFEIDNNDNYNSNNTSKKSKKNNNKTITKITDHIHYSFELFELGEIYVSIQHI